MVKQSKQSLESEPRDRILDAAEIEFSAHGYGSAGMKAIATRADVAQGLIHYYFSNKSGLYDAVVGRRATLICFERQRLLNQVDVSSPDALERIFEAFFEPPLGAQGGGRVYAKIFASLAVGNDRDQELIRKYYDPTARIFIDRICAAVPDLGREGAAWAYSFALGSLIAIIGRDGRTERLIGTDLQAPATPEFLVKKLTEFSIGGVRSLASGT